METCSGPKRATAQHPAHTGISQSRSRAWRSALLRSGRALRITQGKGPRVARPLRGEAGKTHLLTVCGQPAASSRLRHAYMQSAAVHLKNGQVARADRRAPLSYGQPKLLKKTACMLESGSQAPWVP